LSALSSHVPAQGSRLLLFTLESTTASHYADLVSSLKTAGITHLDLVIANAGVAYPAGTPASVDVEDVKNVFDVNALGTLRLFQALRGFLEVGSNNGRRVKWVSVSSAAGSIGGCEVYGTHRVAPYAISKAGVNMVTVLVPTTCVFRSGTEEEKCSAEVS
jgi:NAD(P)-dependent dehydrogenase (short-subunit alcohol dehydrogenase family)